MKELPLKKSSQIIYSDCWHNVAFLEGSSLRGRPSVVSAATLLRQGTFKAVFPKVGRKTFQDFKMNLPLSNFCPICWTEIT